MDNLRITPAQARREKRNADIVREWQIAIKDPTIKRTRVIEGLAKKHLVTTPYIYRIIKNASK